MTFHHPHRPLAAAAFVLLALAGCGRGDASEPQGDRGSTTATTASTTTTTEVTSLTTTTSTPANQNREQQDGDGSTGYTQGGADQQDEDDPVSG